MVQTEIMDSTNCGQNQGQSKPGGPYKVGKCLLQGFTQQAVCAAGIIGAIIRGGGLPTPLLPLVTLADEQSCKCKGMDQQISI